MTSDTSGVENAQATPFVARVVGKGKVTVPKNVRDLLDLHDGDLVEFAAVRKLVPKPEPEPEPKAMEPEAKPETEPKPLTSVEGIADPDSSGR